MDNYGVAAVLAARTRNGTSPRESWQHATRQLFPTLDSQNKGCPKCAFLGLCEEGYVAGIPSGMYLTKANSLNKQYAVAAVRELQRSPLMAAEVATTPKELWRRVVGNHKRHNSQMDVVLALWQSGLIITQ
jgi:hypothetical protein